MLSWLRSFINRINGFSTPVGGVQWSHPQDSEISISKYEGIISITDEGNEGFLTFLEENKRCIVYIDATIYACLATQRQHETVECEQIDLDSVSRGKISDKLFPLLNSEKAIRYIKFALLPSHRTHPSFGGTGVIQIHIQGFFDVSAAAHGGPSIVFHLTEQPASVEMRLKVGAKRSGRQAPNA